MQSLWRINSLESTISNAVGTGVKPEVFWASLRKCLEILTAEEIRSSPSSSQLAWNASRFKPLLQLAKVRQALGIT